MYGKLTMRLKETEICIRMLRNEFLLFLFEFVMDAGLDDFLPGMRVCVCRCVKGSAGAPSLSKCSRVPRCLFHTALETEFIGTRVLLDHLSISTTGTEHSSIM